MRPLSEWDVPELTSNLSPRPPGNCLERLRARGGKRPAPVFGAPLRHPEPQPSGARIPELRKASDVAKPTRALLQSIEAARPIVVVRHPTPLAKLLQQIDAIGSKTSAAIRGSLRHDPGAESEAVAFGM